MADLLGAWLSVGGGLAVLVGGGELLVRGAVRLATAWRVSALVIGLTVVAFGTSAPELAVSVTAAAAGNGGLAVGNVVGSNVFNVLFVLGLSALIVPLTVASRLIRRDVPLMIAASVLVLALGWDGRLGRGECAVLLVGLPAYIGWCLRQSRRETRDVEVEFAREWPAAPLDTQRAWPRVADVVLVAGGLGLLVLGSRWLVAGAVQVAEGLGVSDLVIGVTVVAAGTSLPEVVTSVVAAVRGERDIAVGNAVGSNLFNVLGVLGLAGAVSPDGLALSESARTFDLPVMTAVAVACLPIFLTGHVISRWEGGLFFSYYLAYMTYVILHARDSVWLGAFGDAMAVFVLPLTIVTVSIPVWRHLRRRRNRGRGA